MTSRPTRSIVTAIGVALVVLGVFLRLWQYWANRSLWLDEAMLANNIIGRSFVGLLSPLDEGVVAPIGFLFIEKAIVALLGSTEYALRLFPLVAALVAIMLMVKVAGVCVSRVAALLAMALFVICEQLVYYASEVKPYSSDVMWSLLLLFSGLRCLGAHRQHGAVLSFGLISAAAVWFSHPSVFVFTACFLVLFADAYARRSTRSSDPHALSWLIGSATLAGVSFLLFSGRFMTHDPNVPNLQQSWRGAFMPLPPWKDPVWFGKTIYGLMWNPLGLYFSEAAHSRANHVLAIAAATLLAVGFLSLLFRRWQVALMLTLPFLLTLLASGLRKYPFGGRVLLFTVPLCVLLLAEGIERTGVLLNRRMPSTGLIILVFAVLSSRTIALDWRNVLHPPMYQHIRPAMAYLGAKKLAADIVYLGYVEPPGLPAVRYYAARLQFDQATYPPLQQPEVRADLSPQTVSKSGNASRVWIVFSSACNSCRAGDEKIPLRNIESSGAARIADFESRDASVYLYQFRD
jgi:Dolichyl-phosphate-mannose-protein mannosyltransferase